MKYIIKIIYFAKSTTIELSKFCGEKH